MTFWDVLKREWGLLWRGRFPVAPILFLLPLFFTLAFGVCSPNEVMSIQEPLLYIMPGLLYSGLSWPDFYMNRVAEVIAFLFPMRHAADYVRDILLSGYAPQLASQCLQLLGIGLFCFFLGIVGFMLRRRYGTRKMIHAAIHTFIHEKKGDVAP